MSDASNNTRRYPRTMHGIDGAYPNSPEYASAIHLPERDRRFIARSHIWAQRIAGVIGIAIVIALLAGWM